MAWTHAENGKKTTKRVQLHVDMVMPGKRPRGRPKGRWMDCVRRDMQELRITPEDAQDRIFWKAEIRAS